MENFIVGALCGSIVGMIIAGALVSSNHNPDKSIYDNVNFGSVCQWENGDVQGDSCIQDGVVILTKDDVLNK